MLIEKLLDHYDSYTKLHVDVNDVRDQLVSMGVQDEITFHFVKIDKGKIRGLLYRFIKHNVPYGEPVYCSQICIANDMGEEHDEWQRLVAVKELLHITDCDRLTAASEAAVDTLFHSFSLPPELRNSGLEHKRSVLNDRIQIYLALAVLVPAGCRDPLRQMYGANKITPAEVALMAKIPERYVETVLNPEFEDSIKMFLDWEKAETAMVGQAK